MSRTVLILGGSSGMGLESAKYLRTIGYDVYIAARHNPGIDTLKYLYLDIKEEESIKELFNHFKKNNIELDALVYSIGITTQKKPITDFEVKVFNEIMTVNLIGAILSLKYAYPFLKQSKGKVVMVNSIAAKTFSSFSGIEYTASKAALSGLVKQLSREWAQDRILINSIYPSMTKTKMLTENVDQERIEKICEDIPLQRLASTYEIAKTIAFLLDNEVSYLTGTGIDINGGLYLNG